jgi:hypothetical protein
MSQVQRDVLLAALIGAGWFMALTVVSDSSLRPANPSVSVVTGLFLVITVATGRSLPRTTLVFVSLLYPFVYAAAWPRRPGSTSSGSRRSATPRCSRRSTWSRCWSSGTSRRPAAYAGSPVCSSRWAAWPG